MMYAQIGEGGKILAISNCNIFENSIECSDGILSQFDLTNKDLYYLNGDFIEKDRIAPEIARPSVVTMRQARKALHQLGHLASIESYMSVNASEEEKIDWEFAMEVQRGYPLVDRMRVLLNLTEQDIDDLFTLAHSL